MGFNGKRAIVTGGASGIGEAVVRRLAAQGARVMIADIAPERGEQLAAELSAAGGDVFFCRVDVADAASVEAGVTAAAERFGGLDILISNAGIGTKDALCEDIPVEDFIRVIHINLVGMFLCAKYALPHLRKSHGCIVNTASISSLTASPLSAAYCASKGGVASLTQAVALDYVGDGVRCNAVAPSPCDTALLKSLTALPEEKKGEVIRSISGPSGRLCTPGEVAEAIVFLASDAASFINGVILPVDGGYTAE